MANKGAYLAERSSATLGPGKYLVEIDSCQHTQAKNKLQTPQHATVVKNLDPQNPGFITIFTNDVGYERDSKKKVILDPDTGKPVLSETNTKIARRIFGDLAACAGVEGSFDLPDLVGKKLGIVVERQGTTMKVVKWFPYDDMAEALELEAEALNA